MALIRKHGALWGENDIGSPVIYERYYSATGLLAIVCRHSSGRYHARLFEKGGDDPQWAFPWWGERWPDSLFATEEEAIAHLDLLVSEIARPG